MTPAIDIVADRAIRPPRIPPLIVAGIFAILGPALPLGAQTTQAGPEDRAAESDFGGPTEVGSVLRDDARPREPVLRFPQIDEFLAPWFDGKQRLYEEFGLQIGADFTTLYQGASDVLPREEDDAFSGVTRLYGRWTLRGRDTANSGTWVFKVEYRDTIGTQIAPSELAGAIGYAGVTGTLYSQAKLVLNDFNWQQRLNDGRSGFLVGRFDPNDYINVLGYANPWTTFSNLSVLLDASVAFPDASWGIGGGHWVTDQWYALGGLNDANGTLSDLEFFEGGAEFFSYAEFGWAPHRDRRYERKASLLFWHVDPRDDLDIDSGHGLAFSANWTFDDRWMPFVRLGWSEGEAPICNRSTSVGIGRKFRRNSDVLGLGVNWGDPAVDALDEQLSTEAFYRVQFSKNVALTPSLQYLVDPALNPDESEVWIFGLRFRLTF